MTIPDLVQDFLRRENPLTSDNYRRSLEDFRLFCRVPSIEAAAQKLLGSGVAQANRLVADYSRGMGGEKDKRGHVIKGRGLSTSTINLRLTVVRGLVRKARRLGLINWELDIASRRPEPAKDPRGPTWEQNTAILKAAAEQPGVAGIRDYAILRLIAETGLRRKEILGLDVEDFEGSEQTLWILRKGRSEKMRISISKECVDSLRQWLSVRPAESASGPLFTNLIPGRCSRLSGPALYLIARKLGDPVVNEGVKSGKKFKRVGVHKLRHTSITKAAKIVREKGLTMDHLAAFSGHRDVRMVSRYLDTPDEAQQDITEAISKWL
jgi:integrase/recombinase XerC